MKKIFGIHEYGIKKMTLINEILIELFPTNFQKILVTNKNQPNTPGNLAEKILIYYLTTQFNQQETHSNPELNKNKNILKELNNKIRIKRDKNPDISNLINGASIKSIGYLYRKTTGIINTILYGGRTINEIPNEYLVKNVVDLDIVSCYGTTLANLDYPIGLPTIIANIEGETSLNMTLNEFLQIYQEELVDNLYVIYVKGKLDFDQTLLLSKTIDAKKMNQKINKWVDEKQTQESEIFETNLYTQELDNTAITSDFLRLLRACCSNNELNQIMNTIVITASMYKKSDYVETNLYQEIDKTIQDSQYQYNQEIQGIIDTRSRKWTKISLKGLIDPLIEMRQKAKLEKK